MKKVGNIFVRVWQWFKETAWIQILLIVGAVIGVVLSINPIVSGIQKLMDSNNKVTFYKDNRITYDRYKELKDGQEAGAEKQYLVMFYSDTCSHCEAIQKYVRDFYREYVDEEIYTINIDDDDYISESDKAILVEAYSQVYNNMSSEEKNPDYETFPTSIPTPTFVVMRDQSPYKISLGLSETKPGVYQDLLDLLEIEE